MLRNVSSLQSEAWQGYFTWLSETSWESKFPLFYRAVFLQHYSKYTFFRWSGKRGMWINVAMQAYYGRMLAEGGKRSIRAD